MTEQLPDTWASRDLPVLREAARVIDQDTNFQGVRLQEVANTTGLNVEQVLIAARALANADLVELRLRMPAHAGRIVGISAEARQIVGLWPTAETALDRIIDALEAIAANTDDEDTRTNAQKFRTWLKSGATTVGLGVAQAAITGQLPS